MSCNPWNNVHLCLFKFSRISRFKVSFGLLKIAQIPWREVPLHGEQRLNQPHSVAGADCGTHGDESR